MVSQSRTDAKGRRLEAYIKARWGRSKGGISGFCKETGFSRETVYAWFRGDTEPELGSITTMAAVLGVSRAEIVAVMDGTEPVTTRMAPDAREAMREELRLLLPELLADLGLSTPAKRPRGRVGAA